jgi:group I intron endonuclease
MIKKENFSCIYKITSKINGKVYVGSAKHLGIRRRNHIHRLKKGDHHNIILQRHVNKYGIDSILFEVIEKVESPSLLIEREQHYIDLLHPKFNATQKAVSAIGRKASIETRKKLSDSHRGFKPSNESLIKRSISLKGRVFSEESKLKMKANWYYRPMSEEGRDNWRKKVVGKKLNLSKEQREEKSKKLMGRNNKAVICIDTGKKYESLKSAAQDIGCDSGKISMVCAGKRLTVRGLKFQYA